MEACVFTNLGEANRHFESMLRRGYASSQINVLMRSDTLKTLFGQLLEAEEGYRPAPSIGSLMWVAARHTSMALAVSAGVGSAGSSLFLRKLDLLVVGPAASLLLNGNKGVLESGCKAILMKWGLPPLQAADHADQIRSGAILLGVFPAPEGAPVLPEPAQPRMP
jgi:hypothetical protein